MRFNRIRLNGFKSFVDPTELIIADGLTGVVGPNGCGKSNIIDAVRWVLGESSAKNLRGDAMTDEDYKKFYQDLYPYTEDPLFNIHLNVDYPFNLTGILYFPKLDNKIEIQKNKINLYSNQVFITDDVKDIVPEFLTLLPTP